MDLIFWTKSAKLAELADGVGIRHIGVDLERKGKDQRQGHRADCWITDHDERDLAAIRDSVTQARLFVRTNPMHAGLPGEIQKCLDFGAKTLMLPMFYTVEEAQRFIAYIDGRATAILQVETVAAANRIEQLVELPGVGGIFVGLNDLSLELGLAHRFEMLLTPLMERLSLTSIDAGVPFGFGGIGRVDDNDLPVPPDLVLAQYARLRGGFALVAQVFLRKRSPERFFAGDLRRALDRVKHWRKASPDELEQARQRLQQVLTNLSAQPRVP